MIHRQTVDSAVFASKCKHVNLTLIANSWVSTHIHRLSIYLCVLELIGMTLLSNSRVSSIYEIHTEHSRVTLWDMWDPCIPPLCVSVCAGGVCNTLTSHLRFGETIFEPNTLPWICHPIKPKLLMQHFNLFGRHLQCSKTLMKHNKPVWHYVKLLCFSNIWAIT